MVVYLLDTNIVSDIIRRPTGQSGVRFRTIGSENVALSIIVAAELRFGAAKRRSARLTQRIEEFLTAVDVVAFERPADAFYGDLRAHLESTGQVIGTNDMLIAAHALALGRTLVTDNTIEFARVPALSVENWLR
jgi:tRNA(fMet)-specific endonuclease VapC